jgi:hypothetical protein
MKKILSLLAVVPFASVMVMAQDAGAANSSSTSRWTGLLVAAACPSDSATPRTATLAHEQNTTYEHAENQADRSSTGSAANRDRMPRRTDRGASVDQAVPALTDRVTTPPVDDKGTRGSATPNNPPPTGMKDQANSADRSKNEQAMNSDRDKSRLDSDGSNTSGMDKNCYIGQSTSAFALKLKDGRMVRFDDASNAKIAQQLQSGDRLVNKIKVFRATVKGSMPGDTITVDSIQM